ncbi:hypothetical protein F4810DRAFT_180590 [Camillea tinctor]|nr:hypothetical protein F4810DRAFT_180590 [Camillea tinctor]
MDPSKASTSKTWSDIASQPPSGDVVLKKPGARMTFKASRPAAESKLTAASTSASSKSVGGINPASKRPQLRPLTMPSISEYPGITWPGKTPTQLAYDWSDAHKASGKAIYAQEIKKVHDNDWYETAENGLVTALAASYGKETLATKNSSVSNQKDAIHKEATSFRPNTHHTAKPLPTIPAELSGKQPSSHAIPVPSTRASGLQALAAQAQLRYLKRTGVVHHGADAFMERFQVQEPQALMDRYNSDLGPNGYARVEYPEKGWSSSRTWVSYPEQQRIRYEKMRADLYRSGTEKSPALPQNFAQYVKHQAELAADKEKAKKEELLQLEKDLERLRRAAGYSGALERLTKPVQMSPKLISISEKDCMTLANGRPSMWTKWYQNLQRVAWPPRQEFRVLGDELAKAGLGPRCLPLPRIPILDQRARPLVYTPSPIPKVGPTVPYELRVVDDFVITSIRYDGLSEYEVVLLEEPTCEIGMDELPAATRSFIESI